MIRGILGAIVFFAVLPTTLYLTGLAWEKTLWHIAEWSELAAAVPADHEYIFRFDWWTPYIGEIDWFAMGETRSFYRIEFWWWPGSGEQLYTIYMLTLPLAMLLLPIFYCIPPILAFVAIRGGVRRIRQGRPRRPGHAGSAIHQAVGRR
jgi:hypothetical protein